MRYEKTLTGNVRADARRTSIFGRKGMRMQVELKVQPYREMVRMVEDKPEIYRDYRGDPYTEWRDAVWTDLIEIGNAFVPKEKK